MLGTIDSHRLLASQQNLFYTWVGPTSPPFITWRDITSNGTNWVMVGTIGSGTDLYYAISSDLLSWIYGSIATGLSSVVDATITCNGSTYIITYRGGLITTFYGSSNGTTWSAISVPSGYYTNIASNGSSFVAIDFTNGKALYSTSGSSWTAYTLPVLGSMANWYSISSNGSNYVAIANGISTYSAYSSTGTSWTSSTLPTSGNWGDITSNGSMYVAVDPGNSGSTATAYSTNSGVSWTAGNMPISAAWDSITSNGIDFLATSVNLPYLSYSIDGINWSILPLPTNINRISGKGLSFNNTGKIFGGVSFNNAAKIITT